MLSPSRLRSAARAATAGALLTYVATLQPATRADNPPRPAAATVAARSPEQTLNDAMSNAQRAWEIVSLQMDIPGDQVLKLREAFRAAWLACDGVRQRAAAAGDGALLLSTADQITASVTQALKATLSAENYARVQELLAGPKAAAADGAPRPGPRDGTGPATTGPRDGTGATATGPRDGTGTPSTGPRDGTGAAITGPRDGTGATSAGPRDGTGTPSPGPRDGTGAATTGPRDGAGGPAAGPRDGEGAPKAGPREGDGAPKTGAREGDGAPKTGPREGDGAPKTGAREGDGAPKSGAREGDGAPRPGAREGDGAPKAGAREGEGAPKAGARDGEGGPKTGAREGEGASKAGAREGDGGARPGAREGDGSTKPGARDGEGGAKPRTGEGTAATPKTTGEGGASKTALVIPPDTIPGLGMPGFAVVGGPKAAALLPAPPNPPSKDDAKQALLKAVKFFHTQVSRQGGYLWQYSGDLTLSEAEGKINDKTMVSVQPPGTPAIGNAFLDAYDATGDKACLDAAIETGNMLVRGQMRTGGWALFIEYDPQKRENWGFRVDPPHSAQRWQRATNMDDDVTPSAVRFLARLDKALEFKDPKVHEAVMYALDAILIAQYPNGAWFGWWEDYPKPVDPAAYPVVKARFPENWPRRPQDGPRYPARYILNDDVVPDMVRTLLDVYEVYKDERYLAAAKKAADFLLLAQMPDPQPAWAQHYDVDMQPCWGRKFEPPAITAGESQTVMEALLLMYSRTGETKYLEATKRALDYLKKSLLPDGYLARFYELQTNRPLYFDRSYNLTYSRDDTPNHYAFIWNSRLQDIEAEYQRLAAADPATRALPAKPDAGDLAARARKAVDGLDARGAWVEKTWMRFHGIPPASGVIQCQTFIDNVSALSQYLRMN